MGKLARIASTFKEQYRRVKAEIKGEAISRARRIKTFTEIGGTLAKGSRVARPTGIQFRMYDGKPMVFYTDGSLRHLMGRDAARAAVKRAKRVAKQIAAKQAQVLA